VLTRLKQLILLLLLLMTTSLSGCLTAGIGPQFTQPSAPENGKAIIYVYRERVAMTGHEIPGVKMNDSLMIKTFPELSYIPISVEPGSYSFSPKLFGIYKTTPVTVKAEAGQVYYVTFRLLVGHLQFTQANRDEAMAYMSTCYLINPGFVKDSRVMISAKVVDSPVSDVEPEPVPVSEIVKATVPVEQPKVIEKPVKAALYVEPIPQNARIRIMNIKPKFKQGIHLAGGRYHVEVTAPEYRKYQQWISLKKGEVKHLPVVLQPLQVKIDPVVEKVKVKAAATKPVVKATKISSIKVPANISSEEKRYAGMLGSGSSIDIRNAAKNLYHRYSSSHYLASVAEQSLLKNYKLQTRDSMHVDAMAWLCKSLARTGDSRFSSTLQTVADSAPSRKVRKYAQKSLGQL